MESRRCVLLVALVVVVAVGITSPVGHHHAGEDGGAHLLQQNPSPASRDLQFVMNKKDPFGHLEGHATAETAVQQVELLQAMNARWVKEHCWEAAARGSKGSQTCCTAKSGKASCLPKFIVAGTQKSGSTALTMLLDEHPHVIMSDVKEVHFFDTPPKYAKGIESYLRHFPEVSMEVGGKEKPEFITGEATPFYLASRQACENIAADLPGAKLLVVLRDPVDRAYSEYQMKLRRVSEQTAVLAAVDESSAKIRKCFLDPLLTAGADEGGAAAAIYTKKVAECLGPRLTDLPRWEALVIPLTQRIMERGSKASGTSREAAYRTIIEECFPEDPLGGEVRFNRKCHLKYETVLPMDVVMTRETSHLLTCFKGIGETQADLHRMDEAIEACLGTISKGIANQFIYRSLYAIQLYHCSKHVPMEDIYVIDSQRLEDDTASVMGDVFAFLGLEPYEIAPQDLDPEGIHDLVLQKYPAFEVKSGWRLHSEYEAMPEDLRWKLNHFFAAQNRMLADLLGGDWTDVITSWGENTRRRPGK